MSDDKDEITEELAHHKEMLRLYRRRLRELERKKAQYGINTPPEVNTEIIDLTDSIERHEGEVARLQTEAVVDELPLAEAEYRAILAEVWDTPQARPTVSGEARLELLRLRLGITAQRAKELEHEIRISLAKEKLLDIDVLNIHMILWNIQQSVEKEFDGQIGIEISISRDNKDLIKNKR
jgi:hypothetical protein